MRVVQSSVDVVSWGCWAELRLCFGCFLMVLDIVVLEG